MTISQSESLINALTAYELTARACGKSPSRETEVRLTKVRERVFRAIDDEVRNQLALALKTLTPFVGIQ